MVKATELRTGNYVQNETEALQVESLGCGAVNGQPESSFEPLRLNGNILENCGFERAAATSGPPSGPYRKGPCEIKVQNEYYDAQYQQPNGTPVQYLHQLQNLYYALSGEELQVKL